MYFVKVTLARDLHGVYGRTNGWVDEMINMNRPFRAVHDREWTPEADLYETEEAVVIHVNLAGVRKEDIDVSFDERYLRVSGARTPRIPRGGWARYYHLEMGRGEFERVFSIPGCVDPDRIEASFADGLLTVRMEKRTDPIIEHNEVKVGP